MLLLEGVTRDGSIGAVMECNDDAERLRTLQEWRKNPSIIRVVTYKRVEDRTFPDDRSIPDDEVITE